MSEEAPSVLRDDDIVHPLRKLKDTCNPLVVGSIPTPGATKSTQCKLGGFSLFVPCK